MSNLLFFEDDPVAPRIKNLSELPDDSSTHRWRAHWASDWEGNILGIDLVAYPVVSLTPQGAWIDPNAWREHGLSGPRWALTGQRRWVSNSGGAAWAKPTQEEAIRSIAIRLSRWTSRLHNEVNRARQAAKALGPLRPEDARYVKLSLDALDLIGGSK